MVIKSPCGSWKSPIPPEALTTGAIRFCEMQASQEALYWLELHPKNKGRVSLIRYDGKQTPMFTEVSIRSRVHEYGGGAFFVSKETLIYSNDADYQLYDQEGRALTHASQWRFADGCGPIWVGERHGAEVENCLVSIDSGKIQVIASGHDFYSSPRLSPDGKQLAFITWDFPGMQWDSSTLWLADWEEGKVVGQPHPIAGGANTSVCNIRWSPSGTLYYVCDESGFWNLHRFDGCKGENLCEMEAEWAPPPWIFGMPSYAFIEDHLVICAYTAHGNDHLGRLNLQSGRFDPLNVPYTAIVNVVAWRDKVYFFGGSPTSSQGIICFDPKTQECTTIKKSLEYPLSSKWISVPESLIYKTQDGHRGHALYYPPTNPSYCALEKELPPLLVKAHGGPTARSPNQLSLAVQYWTSRGFAFLDVNYGGSTGFGRAYMRRLKGNWGIIDVEDVILASKVLVSRGLADPDRLLIHGGSAGGYTALAALAFHNVFAGGASLYGVSDLEMLCKDGHKFESKYSDVLIAPYPDAIEVIRQRSPIAHVDKITKPLLLLQGDADTIVPLKQSLVIFEALKEKKIPTGILVFEGEGHGFRKVENIKQALDAQLYFYCDILGIELPEPFDDPPVDIIR